VLSYEALAEGMTPDALIQRVMKAIPVPDKPLAHAKGDNPAGGRG
jgi:MoxR-like ATPase